MALRTMFDKSKSHISVRCVKYSEIGVGLSQEGGDLPHLVTQY